MQIQGRPNDARVSHTDPVWDDPDRADKKPVGVSFRLDSERDLPFWMVITLTASEIEAMYHFINGGVADPPKLQVQ